MKKLLLAALIVVAAPACYAQATATATKTVTISVAAFISVGFTLPNPLAFNITDGGAQGTYLQTAAFSVSSNVPYTISSAAHKPNTGGGSPLTAPGTLAVSTSLDAGVQPPANGAPGTLTATLSGLTYTNAVKGNYASGGSVTVTVVESD